MASDPVECQVLVLRVSIHCEGCKKKVKKVLLHVDGVYRCDVDGRSNKVTVTAARKLDAGVLVASLRKSGKLAEPWPEEPQREQGAAESQTGDPGEPNEPPAGNAEAGAAAEPGAAQTPAPEALKSADESTEPARDGSAGDETKSATGWEPEEAKGEATGRQHPHQDKPIDATVTVEFDRSAAAGHARHHAPITPQPAHVMSYNVARPMTSASYYAAAPAPMPMPMPMARPGPPPSQRYIDEYAPPPSYYSRAAAPPPPPQPPYDPYYYPPQQPSPYHHQHSPAEDYYYSYSSYSYPSSSSPPPQRSSYSSPPREAYGDMFNDENANSCTVM